MELKYTLELPSKGMNLYPPTSPLSSGIVELRYPTAKDEDILSDKALMKNGQVLNEFVKNLIIDSDIKNEVSKGNIYIFDRDAILIRSRILAYGEEYSPSIECPECGKKYKQYKIDLSEIGYKNTENSETNFDVELPISKVKVRIKLLKVSDEVNMAASEKKMKEYNIKTGTITSLLKSTIESVNGNTSQNEIASVVESMPSRDSLFLRNHITSIMPGLDMTFKFVCNSCDYEEEIDIPMNVSFFWPKLG